jgi:hypothetical protein
VYGKSAGKGAGKGAMAMGKDKKGGSSMSMAMPKKAKPAKPARPKAK